ncbi:MAG: hypothetical protein V3T83_15080 [Acidobacteriota bacterium]
MKLKVQAPTRIDLAGATLDIHPLYVFEGGGLTLNAAVDLCSEVEIESRPDGRIHLESLDQGVSRSAASIDRLGGQGEDSKLALLVNILRFYRPRGGLSIRTRSQAPSGSGLGGSSSILVSLSSALVQWENLPCNKTQIIDYGAEIEAQTIGVPTGKQDYYPAAFGGFSALWFSLSGARREPLPLSAQFVARLNDRLILGYSGASRFSGASNWSVLKSYVERRGATRDHMKSIQRTARRMRQCLLEEDFPGLADCLREEWSNRRRLAPGVSTERLESIFEAASRAGAEASKVCGAGGGGCFISLAAEGCRPAVEEAISAQGGRVLDYRFAASGVRVAE